MVEKPNADSLKTQWPLLNLVSFEGENPPALPGRRYSEAVLLAERRHDATGAVGNERIIQFYNVPVERPCIEVEWSQRRRLGLVVSV